MAELWIAEFNSFRSRLIEMQTESILIGQQMQTSQKEEAVAVDSGCRRGRLDSKPSPSCRDKGHTPKLR